MKKYIPFFKAGMMEELAYRAGLFAWMLITVLQLLCVAFLWTAVYNSSSSPVINGFTFNEMIVYFVFTNIFAFMCLGTETLHDINSEIKDGTIAISLIKPISYRIRFLFRALGNSAMRIIIMGIPTIVISMIVFIKMKFLIISSYPVFILHIALFIISMILAIAIYDTIDYICGICCFYTTAAWGLNFSKNVLVNFFSGVLLPLSFFPGNLGKVAEMLPFAGLSQNPIYILVMRVDAEAAAFIILKGVIWFIILNLAAKLLFIKASKKITVQGG